MGNSIYPSIHGSTVIFFAGPWTLFQFPNLYTVGSTPWMGGQPVAKSLPTHRIAQTQTKYKQITMPRVGSEPTILVLEGAKTVHILDCTATSYYQLVYTN
jgi:hypothetical protein